MNTRRSFLAILTGGLAAIASGALKVTPEPIRTSKLFGRLNDSVEEWYAETRRRTKWSGGSPLLQFHKMLKEEGDISNPAYNWFERSPVIDRVALQKLGEFDCERSDS